MSTTSSHLRSTLRSHLPRAGFRWPDRTRLLPRERQDVAVRKALRDHGGVVSLRANAHGNARHDVEQAFVAMLKTARADAVASRVDQFDTPLDWVADLCHHLSWGHFVEEDVFIDLFLRIGRARLDWHANPREPFNTKEHGPLAHAIDAFYSVISGDWLDADEELFRRALPPVLEPAREARVLPGRVGVDPGMTAPDTQGAVASSAAGEPRPQTLTALAGVQEDDDNADEDEDHIQIGKVEVEEVRERLARAEIGEDDDGEEDDDIEMEGWSW